MGLLRQIEVALAEIGRDPNASPESAALWTRWLRCTSDTERLEVLLHGIKVYDSVLMAVREAHCKTLANLGAPRFSQAMEALYAGEVAEQFTLQSFRAREQKFCYKCGGHHDDITYCPGQAVNHGSQTEEKGGEAS